MIERFISIYINFFWTVNKVKESEPVRSKLDFHFAEEKININAVSRNTNFADRQHSVTLKTCWRLRFPQPSIRYVRTDPLNLYFQFVLWNARSMVARRKTPLDKNHWTKSALFDLLIRAVSHSEHVRVSTSFHKRKNILKISNLQRFFQRIIYCWKSFSWL